MQCQGRNSNSRSALPIRNIALKIQTNHREKLAEQNMIRSSSDGSTLPVSITQCHDWKYTYLVAADKFLTAEGIVENPDGWWRS